MRLRIRLIRTNPPHRYCTKRAPVWMVFPNWSYCESIADYIAAFNRNNHLKD